MPRKAVAAEVFFTKTITLDHRAHRTIEDKDTLRCCFGKGDIRPRPFLFRNGVFILHLFNNSLNTSFNRICSLPIGRGGRGSAGNMNGCLEVIDNLHGLFYLLFIMEIHFEMDAITTNIVEQWTEFIKRYPTSHDTLAAFENLPI